MSRRSQRIGGPPSDQPWFWLTEEILISPAWRALTLNARRLIDRILLEHMAHAGTQNGALRITYDDFVIAGLPSRNAVAQAIRLTETLGLVDVPLRGRRSYGGGHIASEYELTWLPRWNGERASNRWKQVTSADHAARIVRLARVARANKAPVQVRVVNSAVATA